jgi:hypothetical protein
MREDGSSLTSASTRRLSVTHHSGPFPPATPTLVFVRFAIKNDENTVR